MAKATAAEVTAQAKTKFPPGYMTPAEIAFASKVHIAAFAQKDTSKKIGGTDVKQVEIAGTKANPAIQDVNGVPSFTIAWTAATGTTAAKATVNVVTQKAQKDTLHGAIDLTTKRPKPTWDRVSQTFINGWTNGVGA
jgi:hypothetical protein